MMNSRIQANWALLLVTFSLSDALSAHDMDFPEKLKDSPSVSGQCQKDVEKYLYGRGIPGEPWARKSKKVCA